MKYIYLLLLILVLYYLFLNIYQKYSNQEDFDPSLVPVSSIVTLAKVAQKLVDGGGTLTNPGNLQIGLPSSGALGNLYVTGTNKVDGVSKFNGNTTMGNTLGVTGATTMGSTLDVTGVTTLNGGVNITGTNGTTTMTEVNGTGLIMNNSISAKNMSIGPYSDPTYDVIRSAAPAGLLLSSASKNVYVWGNNDLRAQHDVHVDNNLNVKGAANITGATTVSTLGVNDILTLKGTSNSSNGQINDKDGVSRLLFFNSDQNTYYDSGSGNTHYFRGYKGGGSTNVNIIGNLDITGTIKPHAYVYKTLQNQNTGNFLSHNESGKIITVKNPDARSFWKIVHNDNNSVSVISTDNRVIIGSGQSSNGSGTADLNSNTTLGQHVHSWWPLKFGVDNCWALRDRNDGNIDYWAQCWGNYCGSDCNWIPV